MKFAKIPMATINRLSIYLRNLDELMINDVEVISSERLAKQCGVNPAQIRKDLAYFGEFGVRGVGYRVKDLYSQIQEILGLNRPWNMALFGVGNLGSALIRHANFLKHGYRFVAAFDVDPEKGNGHYRRAARKRPECGKPAYPCGNQRNLELLAGSDSGPRLLSSGERGLLHQARQSRLPYFFDNHLIVILTLRVDMSTGATAVV
jgi:hypothetical protein